MKQFKGTIGNLNSGQRTNYYKSAPTTEHERILLKKHGLDKPFECFSIGNEKGQIALVPCDNTGREVAKANADLFSVAHELLEILMTIENDDGSIPKAIWDKRNSVINRALAGN
jgi:hypothetical protein